MTNQQLEYQQPYVQNPMLVTNTVIPQLQSFTLQPVNQYEIPSPATTPPPYVPYAVTTPPQPLFSPDVVEPLPKPKADLPVSKKLPTGKKKTLASKKKKLFQKFKK